MRLCNPEKQMIMKKFKSSFSSGMLLSTYIVTILLLYAIYVIALRIPVSSVGSWQFWMAVAALCIIIAAMFHGFVSQIEYVGLTENSVVIQKRVGKITIPFNDIRQVRYKKSLVRDIRLWGISGYFGHIGLFRSGDTGNYKAFVKNGNAMIEIKTVNQTYVVSCDGYEQLLEILNKRCGQNWLHDEATEPVAD